MLMQARAGVSSFVRILREMLVKKELGRSTALWFVRRLTIVRGSRLLFSTGGIAAVFERFCRLSGLFHSQRRCYLPTLRFLGIETQTP